MDRSCHGLWQVSAARVQELQMTRQSEKDLSEATISYSLTPLILRLPLVL